MKRILSIICLAGVLLTSCKDDDDGQQISTQQSSAVQDQAVADAYYNDASDMSTSAYNSPSQSNLSGRTAETGKLVFTVTGDTRFNGAVLTLDASGTVSVPQGTITVDFGTGQTDPAGTKRAGKIIVTYSGYRFVVGSYFTITFDGYSVNGVKVEGKRTVTTSALDNTSVTFAVKDENGKLTFTDNTTVTRQSDHTRKWVKGATFSANQWVVEGTASGTTRDGKSYSIAISTALVFKVECALNNIFIASEGVAVLTVDGVSINLNYGAAGAACDKVITVTAAGGVTTDVTVS